MIFQTGAKVQLFQLKTYKSGQKEYVLSTKNHKKFRSCDGYFIPLYDLKQNK